MDRRMTRIHLQQGLAYLAVMFLVFSIVLAASAASVVWHIEARRASEQELLFQGMQFAHALASYQDRHVNSAQQYPIRLEQLVRDANGLQVHRDLRRIYIDPLTASADWGLVRQPDGAIVGVYSRATGKPIQQANFPKGLEFFANAKSYRDWVFIPLAASLETLPAPPAPPAQANLPASRRH